MNRKLSKKDYSKTDKEKREMPKQKLPYLPPTQKILDIEKDMNDIIYPPDLDEKKEKKGFFKRIAASSNKLKYKIMKKFNLPEIYADILFFIIEILIAILLIYIIMTILLIFRGSTS